MSRAVLRALLSMLLYGWCCLGCALPGGPGPRSSVLVAHLAEGGDPAGFARVQRAFQRANPDHALAFARATRRLAAGTRAQAVFVQAGAATAFVGAAVSPLAVGDLVLLRPGQALVAAAPLDLVVFTLPADLEDGLPTFVRPDWDPGLTDQPGGCATETGAYRRILLTWLPENGPYVSHALNAHRVRITDSFTHYHPVEGGFDELYLVQMVQPDARVLTSDAVAAIESGRVTRAEAARLFDETPLSVGDLVYLPRGTVHRGLGGVLAQVIAVPGFRPGTEIGVDAQLRALNEALELTGADALPVHPAR